MNVKEYISSGVLEAYALGILSDEESKEVQHNLVLYTELREELKKIEQAQEQLLMRASIAPPSGLKEQVMSRAQSREKEVIYLDRPDTMLYWKIAVAASLAFAIVAIILAMNYRNKWKSTELQLTALENYNRRVAEDYNRVNQNLDKLQREVEIISDPQFKQVVMKGTPNSPEALATVYWNESTEEVFLRIQNMKALAQESQYQLWAIVDGKPVDAGVFDFETAGLLKMKNVARGAIKFAVTIEPQGGKSSPTLETMQVIGDVENG